MNLNGRQFPGLIISLKHDQNALLYKLNWSENVQDTLKEKYYDLRTNIIGVSIL